MRVVVLKILNLDSGFLIILEKQLFQETFPSTSVLFCNTYIYEYIYKD